MDHGQDEAVDKPTYLHGGNPIQKDFILSEAAAQIFMDEDFGKIYNEFMEKAQEAVEAGEIMPNLPQEDDAGNIEYKLRLTNLTMEKVRKRTTQMAFRLKVSLPLTAGR